MKTVLAAVIFLACAAAASAAAQTRSGETPARHRSTISLQNGLEVTRSADAPLEAPAIVEAPSTAPSAAATPPERKVRVILSSPYASNLDQP